MSSVEHLPEAALWKPRLMRWGQRLHAARLDGLAGTLLDVLEPLGPFGAHLLWIAQPALGLVVPRGDVDSLARLLDAPGGLAWFRDQLAAGQEPPDSVG